MRQRRHRLAKVSEWLAQLTAMRRHLIELHRLPAYSPEFMAMEGRVEDHAKDDDAQRVLRHAQPA
jgi:hypothetical protein